MQVNRQINQKTLFFLLLRYLRFKFKKIIRIFEAEKYRNGKSPQFFFIPIKGEACMQFFMM